MSTPGDESRQGPNPPSSRRVPRTKVPSAFFPSPEGTYITVDKLARLLDQIAEVLGDSMTSLGKATAALAQHSKALGEDTSRRIHDELTRTAASIERVCEMAHGAMQNRSLALGSPLLSRARPITIREAVEHAAELLRPVLDRQEIDLKIQIPDDVASTPAGPLYTVILNALQNAIESIERRRGPGAVTVSVRKDAPPRTGGYGRDSREWQTLEVLDDGEGPPQTHEPARVFDLGFSTKPRGTGVGLAVARSVVQSMGGTIELVTNNTRAPVGKRGAVLRACYPAPDAFLNIRLGGVA
ncbi:MAG: Sensor protein FixL [Planctomycetota bacterium]|jgi:signal transduction histidine kinase